MREIKAYLILATFVAVPLVLGAWSLQAKIANNARAEIGRSLTTLRDTTNLAVKTLFKDQ